MAIYHLSAQIIGRSKGKSALSAAAYRSASKIRDEAANTTYDYSRKKGVFATKILAPSNAPDWAFNREELWNKVEARESRINSQFAREFNMALPHELSNEARRELVEKWVDAQFISLGLVADISYHDFGSINPHAHVMVTTRTVNENGFERKTRECDKKDFLLQLRETWAKYANYALTFIGSSERIDHRSLEEQGIGLDEQIPQFHLGAKTTAMVRKGISSERYERYNEIESANQILKFNRLLEREKQEKERLEEERLERERLEKERLEEERLERERLEKERLEEERLERERLKKERLEEERLERERLEKQKQQKERQEKERLERERIERENKEIIKPVSPQSPIISPQSLPATELNDQQVIAKLIEHNKLLQSKKELDQLLSKWEKLRFDFATKVWGTELWFEENHRKSGWLDFNGCDPDFYDKVYAEYEINLLNLAASEKNYNIVIRRIDAFNRKKSDYNKWLSSPHFKQFVSNPNNLKEIFQAYKTGSTFLQKVGIKKGNKTSHTGHTYTLEKIDNTLYISRQDKPHPILIVTGEDDKITDVISYGFDDSDKQLFQTIARKMAKELNTTKTISKTPKPKTINKNQIEY